jgi:peptidoglycan/LPS O-acetylase OafA/YrhL
MEAEHEEYPRRPYIFQTPVHDALRCKFINLDCLASTNAQHGVWARIFGSSMEFRADIEGLRGLAVLMVVFFHLNWAGFSGGFMGVDIFYVISGFLITQLISRDLNANRFRLLGFYSRRAARILPALLVMLAACAVAVQILYLPTFAAEFGADLKWTLVFVSNYLYQSRTGYFSDLSANNPLLHTWSLSVEEQYYLIIPILMRATHRRISPASLFLTLGALSFAAAIIGGLQSPEKAFFSSPDRFWEFLVGALAGVARPRLGVRMARWCGLGGLVAVIASLVAVDGTSSFPIPAPFVAVCGAALIMIGAETSLAGRLLTLSPVRFVGKISYSLYLWHWPIITLVRYVNILPIGPTLQLASFVASLLAGYLSWRMVERPWRRSYHEFPFRAAFVGATAGLMLLIVGFGFTKGVLARSFDPSATKLLAYEGSFGRFRGCLDQPFGQCRLGAAGTPSFILWGDSYAAAIADGLDVVATKNGKAGVMVVTSSCPPMFDVRASWSETLKRCEAQNQFMGTATRDPTITLLIMHAAWHGAPGWTALSEPKIVGDLRRRLLGNADWAAWFAAKLSATFDALQRPGLDIVIIDNIPTALVNVPQGLAVAKAYGRDVALGRSAEDFEANLGFIDRIIDRVAKEHGVRVLHPSESLCDDVKCRVSDGERPLFADGGHLNRYGALDLAVLNRIFEMSSGR